MESDNNHENHENDVSNLNSEKGKPSNHSSEFEKSRLIEEQEWI
jgi:hypothetical protein